VIEIDFHFNVSDRLAYVCRLLRKAVASGAELVVTGSVEKLIQLDHELWTFSNSDFVPHCFMDAPTWVLAKSPVVLTTSLQTNPLRRVLLNLGEQVPISFDQFERVIEVVTTDEVDRELARFRWKQYSGLGCTLIRHDLHLRASS
jgi:DNA polymerase-3 subunit chi